MNQANTITIIRGTSQSFEVTFSDDSGNPIDITGYTIYFTVKTPFQAQNETDTSDKNSVIQVLASLTTPVSGIATVTLSTAQTSIDAGNYLYDIRTISGGGFVASIPAADFIVEDPVTNRES